MKKITKVEQTDIRYFDLFSLLEGLEFERPGIKDRIWNFLKKDDDIQFQPIHGRILGMNLFYYGVGDEYPIVGLDTNEIERSHQIHPEAFVVGTLQSELRKDLNLIWSVYEVTENEVEIFYIEVNW